MSNIKASILLTLKYRVYEFLVSYLPQMNFDLYQNIKQPYNANLHTKWEEISNVPFMEYCGYKQNVTDPHKHTPP